MGEIRESVKQVKAGLGRMYQMVPGEMKGFSQFMDAVMTPGKLDVRTKELIALATALTARCKYCIGMHVESALKAGVSEEEIWEAATVAVLMGGGPALTHVAELHKALQEFGASKE